MKNLFYQELFVKYQLPLYQYLVRLCHSREMAEELMQETFYRALLSLEKRDLSLARAWLYKVARHLYIDWSRKQQTERKLLPKMERQWEMIPSIHPTPEEALLNSESARQIEEIFECLPEAYRSLLYLREMQNFSYQELAETLDITLHQVKTNLHRARAKFRELGAELL
ncbi:MAG: sigma-24 subunit of subfamily polymerase [Bacilli bacterium]|nr:sigma-24 subunit of subfamily polymerase [Bacilli bacterium]